MNLRAELGKPRPAHTWLLLGLALVIAPHLAHLPWVLMLFCGAVFFTHLGLHRAQRPLPPRWLRNLLTVAGFGLVLWSHHSIVGRQAGVSLLLVMLCLKLLEVRERRDGAVLVLLGYFTIATAFLFSQSAALAAYLLGCVVVLTTALMALTVGSARLAPAATLVAQAAPLAVALFFLFPRLPGPLWGMPEESGDARTGLSDTMSPGAISQLINDDSVAFRAQFSGTPPNEQQWYWRGPVLSQFDGRTWSDPNPARVAATARPEPTDTPVDYSIMLQPHNAHWLPALDRPEAAPPGAFISDEYELLSQQPVKSVLRYAAQADLAPRDATPARPAHRYLQLPRGYAPRTQALATELRHDNATSQEVVARALDYIHREPFYYTLQPPRLEQDPVDEFLFDTRRGFCEHYASAFVVLMRQAGIPARVVTGYLGAETNPLGDYVIVRQSDAHAWAEVWLPEQGWSRVDPTAAIAPERVETQGLARSLTTRRGAALDLPFAQALWHHARLGWDSAQHVWNEWVVGYSNTRQASLLNRLGFAKADWRQLGWLLLITCGLIVGAAAYWLLREQPTAKDAVQKHYERFCCKLARAGLTRAAHESPNAYAERISETRPDLRFAVHRITLLYTRLRYSHRAPRDGVAQLRRAVGRLRI